MGRASYRRCVCLTPCAPVRRVGKCREGALEAQASGGDLFWPMGWPYDSPRVDMGRDAVGLELTSG